MKLNFMLKKVKYIKLAKASNDMHKIYLLYISLIKTASYFEIIIKGNILKKISCSVMLICQFTKNTHYINLI